jgi:dolichol-phosphate mannosyltransferase
MNEPKMAEAADIVPRTAELKAHVVLGLLQGTTTIPEVCRQNNLTPAEIGEWLMEAQRDLLIALTARPGAQAALRDAPYYSEVIPIYNEAENLPALYRRLSNVLIAQDRPYEMVFVDDGSSDASIATLREYAAKDARLKCIVLARNFGHQKAITCGVQHASGEIVAIMDGDLQDSPEVLPQFFAKLAEGNDVVYAIRRKRKEGLLKRLAYWLFYRIMKLTSYIDIPLDSGDFCVMSRRVVDVMKTMPERDRFVRGVRSWVGFRQTGLECERDARLAGTSKYTFSKLVKLGVDGIFSFSYLPLRLVVYAGLFVSSLSIVLAIYYLANQLFGSDAPQGFTTLAVLILLLAGTQLITMGIMGEYIGRIHTEVKQRPHYTVAERIGFEPTARD